MGSVMRRSKSQEAFQRSCCCGQFSSCKGAFSGIPYVEMDDALMKNDLHVCYLAEILLRCS